MHLDGRWVRLPPSAPPQATLRIGAPARPWGHMPWWRALVAKVGRELPALSVTEHHLASICRLMPTGTAYDHCGSRCEHVPSTRALGTAKWVGDRVVVGELHPAHSTRHTPPGILLRAVRIYRRGQVEGGGTVGYTRIPADDAPCVGRISWVG